ncbi:hypothetical protein B6D87_09505 [Pseudomonas fragi]|nr:hypothetical protein B6D87_09505 [Pseudomonas fragi]
MGTFGSAGDLHARSVNLRTAATLIRLTANSGRSSLNCPSMWSDGRSQVVANRPEAALDVCLLSSYVVGFHGGF